VTVFASTNGIYNLDLISSGHGIADTASNPLTDTDPTGADQTYIVSITVIDTIYPRLESIERYNPASQNTTSQTLIYMATFSENVTGVDASDFILSPDSAGGTGGGSSPVTDVSGSDDVYSVTVFASTNGIYNLDLISSGHGIADTASNPLTDTDPTGADQTYIVSITVIDTIYPRLESIERYNPASQNTTSQTLIYMATFSENVTGVDASDFILSPDSTWGGNTSASTGQFTHTRSPNLAIPYDVTVSDTITVSSSGTVASVSVTVDITHTYIGDLKIDIIAPDGTSITLHDNSGGSTVNIDQPYAPLFGSIPISGVWTLQIHDRDAPDPGVLNSWTLTINYSGSGDVYYVTVSALQDGIYNLDLVSSGHGITDAAANPLTNTTPTTGIDQTYTVRIIPPDNTVPTLVSIQRSSPAVENTGSQTLVYEVTFSEDVTGVTESDFTLSSDSAGGENNGISSVTDISGSYQNVAQL
jgi:subtilisin-like proprotein convertase family protein